MVEWLRKIIIPNLEDEELNRLALNLNMILFITFVVICLGIVAMLLQLSTRSLGYVISNAALLAVAIPILFLCYTLSRMGQVQTGSTIFIIMITVACIAAMISGGTRTALPVILVIPVVTAGLTLGSGFSLAFAGFSLMILLLIGLLEGSGAIRVNYPPLQTIILLNMFDVGFGFFFVALSIWLAGYSLRLALQRSQRAMAETDQLRQELEKSLAAEQQVRDRLQRAINEYAAFLGEIGQGNYQARLTLAGHDEDLQTLGKQINATVDTLTTAVTQSEAARAEMEKAQRQHLLQAWQEYVRVRPATDFELARPGAAVPHEQVQQAVRDALTKGLSVAYESDQAASASSQSVLAVPITLRDQVIGALSLGREGDGRAWTAEDQALVESVVERLALAADNVRLFEEAQRLAARQQMIGQVTARIRESLDLESVLRTAAHEIGERMGLNDLTIQLETEDRAATRAGEPALAERG